MKEVTVYKGYNKCSCGYTRDELFEIALLEESKSPMLDIVVHTVGFRERVPLDKILFFWQKIVGKDRTLLTQIVRTSSHRGSSNMCNCLAHIESHPKKIDCVRDEWSTDRLAYNVERSLDEVSQMILKLNPSQKFVTLRRAYTNADNRVILPYPSPLTERFQEIFKNDDEHISGAYDWSDLSAFKDSVFAASRRFAAGGGGAVDGYPVWWLKTYDQQAIQLLDEDNEIRRAMETAAAS